MEAKRAGKHIVRDGGIYADGSIDFLLYILTSCWEKAQPLRHDSVY